MGKTMRTLIALLALTGCVHAQTYKTVTADTNNVIRTNFSLVRSQVSDLSGASFAISNVTGLQTALDGKLATNGSAAGLSNFPASLLTTNGSAAGLTSFPSSVLQTNSSLSAFPPALLRTNGDGSGLTNLPNANLSNAIGILPISNGGTGSTNEGAARTALGLGSAATNDASAFQPSNTNLTALAAGNGSNLTNVTVTDASSLTNFPASLLRTNGSAAGLTNFPANLLRTNGDGSGLTNVSVDLTTVLPAYSNNAGKVLAVAAGATNVEWTAISNTVTDASALTNFPAIILQTNSADGSFPQFLLRTNGSAAGLTSFPAIVLQTNSSETAFPQALLRTNGSAAGLTNFPTLNQNTIGTASNVTGVIAISNGGSGQTTAAAAAEAFLPAYSGNANRILALNSNANGLVWTTNSGGGGGTGSVDLSTTNATGILPLSKGGTGGTNAGSAINNLVNVFSGDGLIKVFQDSIMIGSGTGADTRAIAIGKSASTYLANDSIAIGTQSQAQYNAVAIGLDAIANGASGFSVQIGSGQVTNGFQIASWGNVNSNEWGALANVSTIGTNLMRMTAATWLTNTNTANFQGAIFTATTTNAPTNTNAPTPSAWLDIRVGTNDYKLPLWQ